MPKKKVDQDVEVTKLAAALCASPALRTEAVAIAQKGRTGKPSQEYMDWKHELNVLAHKVQMAPTDMLIVVIQKAIALAMAANKENRSTRPQ